MTHPSRQPFDRNAFTLVELLVTIAILALLIGLVVKGVSHFREAAWKADTQNELVTISTAIQQYYSTFHAYPGPISNTALGNSAVGTPIVPDVASSNAQFNIPASVADLRGITGSENLVLGLMGGLKYDPAAAGTPVIYDPALIGQGPRSLTQYSPKKYGAFLEDQKLLSWRTVNSNQKSGHYQDEAGEANDTVVPEFVDRFPQAMPILFLRANAGATVGYTAPTALQNGVIVDNRNSSAVISQYNLAQIIGYTDCFTGTWPSLSSSAPGPNTKSIGEGKHVQKGAQYQNGSTAVNTSNYYHGLRTINPAAKLTKSDANYQYPYDAYPYLANPTLSDTPRQKDQFILISAGPDRIYGTDDDITTFGSVGGD